MNIKGKQILTESFIFRPLLVESDESGKIVARGQFGKADIPTANKRVYPRKLWERELKTLAPRMEKREIFGELDHPADGATKLQRVSHLVTKAELTPDGQIIGEAVILPDTRGGRQLMAILKNGGRVGVSSRGFGSVHTNEEGYDIVQDDYQLMTWDFVADPAATGSYPKFTNEQKNGDDMNIQIKESTNNESYGFFGTLRDNYSLKRSEATKVFDYFESKFKKMKEFNAHENMARDFLDSKYGRHFADGAEMFGLNEEPTVKEVIQGLEKALKKWGLKGLAVLKFAKEYNPEDYAESLQIELGKALRENTNLEETFIAGDDTEDDTTTTTDDEVNLEDESSEDDDSEEAEDKMEALVRKIRKEESEKAVRKLSESIDELKESIREDIKSELESDPKIAGAKLAIEGVKKHLRPYIIGEDISEELSLRETQIESLKNDVSAKDAQLSEYAAITKELGYKLRVEQTIADYPNKKAIRQRMGDVTRFESLKQLDAKLHEVLKTVQDEMRRYESKGKKKDAEILTLRNEIETLKEAYNNSLEVAQEYGIKAYMERVLAGNPAAIKIKKIVENRNLKKPEEVDALIEQFRNVRTPGSDLRRRIGNRFKSTKNESLVEDQIQETKPRAMDEEIAPGVRMSDIERLS